MARVIGNGIKPDWSVVRYETNKDFEHLHRTFEDLQARKGIYELCRGLLTLDDEFNPSHTISQMMILINSNAPQVRLRIYPCIADMPDLEVLMGKINDKFIDNNWHKFSSYEEMVRRVAKDYNEWLEYAAEKDSWDKEQLWSSTDAGYNLVFPIWRDVERIINS